MSMKKWIPWNWFKTVTMPRKAAPQVHAKQIAIQSA